MKVKNIVAEVWANLDNTAYERTIVVEKEVETPVVIMNRIAGCASKGNRNSIGSHYDSKGRVRRNINKEGFPIGLAVTKTRTGSASPGTTHQNHHSGLGYLTPYEVTMAWRKNDGSNQLMCSKKPSRKTRSVLCADCHLPAKRTQDMNEEI